jgi:predicted Rossmann fold nucleotide-binding protein DprA/Smf involved in DNA uptake
VPFRGKEGKEFSFSVQEAVADTLQYGFVSVINEYSAIMNDACCLPNLDRFLGKDPPEQLWSLGDIELLRNRTLALFCSVKCPGNLILQTYDLAQNLRETGITVIGGFHSPMEKECLSILLRGKQPVIICPARGLEDMRIPAEWKPPLKDGRLLILSPFDGKIRRPTADIARERNRLVAAIADKVFVAHAAKAGKTEEFCREILAWRKPLLTLDSPDNARLLTLGACPIKPQQNLPL